MVFFNNYVLFAIPVISKKQSGLPDEKSKPVKVGLSEYMDLGLIFQEFMQETYISFWLKKA